MVQVANSVQQKVFAMRPKPPSRIVTIAKGSFAEVIRAFQSSQHFLKLEPSTRSSYARILRVAEEAKGLGGLPVEVIRPSLVQAFLDAFVDMPGRQAVARTTLKSLEKWAIVRDLLPHPITIGTSVEKSDGGHEPWSFEQVALAEQHARTDIARVVTLMVHTGQRGSDIVRMRWSDIETRDGIEGIRVTQQKTGKKLWIPFTDELAAVLATWERKPPFFLVLNPRGKPYTRPVLSRHWVYERDTKPALAPLAGLVLHGLRATAVVRARKDGLTDLQISNMYGMSEPMVARYSRLADQGEMAIAAVIQLNRTASERNKAVRNVTPKIPAVSN